MTNILNSGEQLGSRYKIEQYLDAGGMQEVYIAFDKVLNRKVALKTPKNRHAEKRFKRSAILSAKVNHPNIAKLFDYFEEGDRAFLIEELIDGDSLHKVLESLFIYFDPHLLAQFGHHLSKGVAASHHAGVIHRDLKPGNILIEIENGIYCFKITDFGIAILAESEFEEAGTDEASITGSQTMMGAIPYMAPEMIKGPKYADNSSDIWALGAIMYKLMTGKHPYGVGLSAIPKISDAKLPIKPSGFHRKSQFVWLNDELWKIITMCLKKDMDKRPTADELVELFSNLCYGVFPRRQGFVKNYKTKKGDWGFLTSLGPDVFFHGDSFYGDMQNIVTGCKVLYAEHKGGGANRAHPVLPLK